MHLIDFMTTMNDDQTERYAAQIAAMGDPLSMVEDCPPETVPNAGQLVRELAERIREESPD
jgi:hypothetical protein